MEADLAAAERQLTDPAAPAVEPWVIPEGLGLLPEHLVDRAVAMQDSQQAVGNLLEDARTAAGRHLTAVRSVPPARTTGTALYLDVRG